MPRECKLTHIFAHGLKNLTYDAAATALHFWVWLLGDLMDHTSLHSHLDSAFVEPENIVSSQPSLQNIR
jgi:hypothetical protein